MLVGLAVDEIAKSFIGCEENRTGIPTSEQDCPVVRAGLQFGDVKNFVAVAAQANDDLQIDIFVGNDLQPASLSAG
jgi:hypothetical protein